MFFVSFFAIAQGKNVFIVNFELGIIDGETGNAKVSISKNGTFYKLVDAKRGKFTLTLDFGAEYIFACTKIGYISKSILFDTHVPEGRENGDFGEFDAAVGLKKQEEGEEIVYGQPVGKVTFDAKKDDFDYDTDFTLKADEMQKKAKVVASQKTPSIPVVEKIAEIKKIEEKPKVVLPETVPQKKIIKNKTERITQEDRKKITTITVNINDVDYVYKKEEYSWGGTYFHKGNSYISEQTFEVETK